MAVNVEKLKTLFEKMLDEKLSGFEKRVEERISRLERGMNLLATPRAEAYSPISAGLLRPSWLRTLRIIRDEFGGRATVEVLAEKLGIRRSVVSSYLSELQELQLVKKKHNHTSMPGRYLFAITESGEETLRQTSSGPGPTAAP